MLLRCQTPAPTKQQAARNKTSLRRKDFIGVEAFPPPRPIETNFPVIDAAKRSLANTKPITSTQYPITNSTSNSWIVACVSSQRIIRFLLPSGSDCPKSWLVGLPDISNNVGPVKSFLSRLLRSLLRVVLFVSDGLLDDHGSFRNLSVGFGPT